MPQLDFFIYPAIIIQSIFGIFILFYLLMEPILTIFKSLKTRKLLMGVLNIKKNNILFSSFAFLNPFNELYCTIVKNIIIFITIFITEKPFFFFLCLFLLFSIFYGDFRIFKNIYIFFYMVLSMNTALLAGKEKFENVIQIIGKFKSQNKITNNHYNFGIIKCVKKLCSNFSACKRNCELTLMGNFTSYRKSNPIKFQDIGDRSFTIKKRIIQKQEDSLLTSNVNQKKKEYFFKTDHKHMGKKIFLKKYSNTQNEKQDLVIWNKQIILSKKTKQRLIAENKFNIKTCEENKKAISHIMNFQNHKSNKNITLNHISHENH
jgi:hypothetical protein